MFLVHCTKEPLLLVLVVLNSATSFHHNGQGPNKSFPIEVVSVMDCGCENKERGSKELVLIGVPYRCELQWNVMMYGRV